MEVCRAPEAYASSILKVVRFCIGWRVAGVIGAASGSNLRRRIENIMSIGNTKRRADGASRLLAGMLVGVALLILVGTGIYSRPCTVNAAAKETVGIGTGNGSDRVVPEPLAAIDRRSFKKTKQQPPPPPPAAPIIAAPPAPPSVPSTSSPSSPPSPASPASQPEQPTPPTAPAVKQEKPDKPDKNKISKEKSKDKVGKGELIEAPQPVYPEEAKKQKIEGMVVVAIVLRSASSRELTISSPKNSRSAPLMYRAISRLPM